MSDSEGLEVDVEQINRLRREFERAENAGDPSAVDEFCAEDIRLVYRINSDTSTTVSKNSS